MLEKVYKNTQPIEKQKRIDNHNIRKRIRIGAGLFLQVMSVCLFIAFVSHLIYQKFDQAIVESISEIGIRSAAKEIKNWIGIVGAIVSYYLIFRWLGIAAFFILPSIFLIGHRLAYSRRFYGVSIVRVTYLSILIIVWTCLTIASLRLTLPRLFEWITPFVGGIGFILASICIGLFGWATVFVILGSIFGIFASIVEKEKIINIYKKLQSHLPRAIDTSKSNKVAIDINSPEISYTQKDPMIKSSVKPIKPDDFELIITTPSNKSDTPTDPNKISSQIVVPALNLSTEDLSEYKFPEVSLLNNYQQEEVSVTRVELEQNKKRIVETLINFNIGVSSIYATIGPTVTLYEIIPDPGVKISRIKSLEDDIALSLAALGIRIIAPIPGRGTIGIEVPNKNKQTVPLRSIIDSEKFRTTTMALPIVMGKGIDNESCIVDLAAMPHLLIAGATGQGKSVGINVVLASLLYKKHPSQLRLVLVDPKKVELSLYSKLENHFLAKLPGTQDAIITETKKVIHTLKSLCTEMDDRYELLKDAGVRNIKEYNTKFNKNLTSNNKNHRFLPYIVLVIDEFADLMMVAGKEIEMPIARLAQLARAIGIHLVLATQRPSVNIITGIIKANFPVRISFKVSSKVDSRTILDTSGADQLVGRGDFLLSMNSDILRLQCPFLDTDEVERICSFIGDQPGYSEPYLLPELDLEESEKVEKEEVNLGNRDPLFAEAAQIIVASQQGSTSLIQRRLKLGYNRAGRLMDQLEFAGIVGGQDGSKPREVLIQDQTSLEFLLKKLDIR